MYAMQGAPFLAFVQVIVYTGAVLMLFLFVVMLIGITSADSLVETIRGQRLWAGLAGIGLAVLLIVGIGHAAIGTRGPADRANGTDNLTGLAQLIFTTYVFPFEVTSALLITAALGAMVLAHRERTSPKPTQREVARRKIDSGQVAARAAARRLRAAQRRRHAGHAAGRHAPPTVRCPTRWSSATCSSAATRRAAWPPTSPRRSGSTTERQLEAGAAGRREDQ